jgi:thiosulfate reductase cytochrome b subunit
MLALLLVSVVLFGAVPALAARSPAKVETQPSPFHPDFPLLDSNGQQVLKTGQPISTMQTCGACHDTAFIEEHSLHASAGMDDLHEPGEVEGVRAWDTSPGLYGKWNPLVNRTLSTNGEERPDLGSADWIRIYGPRHVGGGPAVYSQSGVPLDELEVFAGDLETHVVDPETGELVPWNWTDSGVVEMNCFLCHTEDPDNEARVEALHDGAFGWANTATLLGSGIVEESGNGYRYIYSAFDADGNVALAVQDPENDNCGLCHGLVHDELDGPLTISGCVPERYRTVTSGQIVSPQRLSDSGMNLENKDELTRSWDVHSERLLSCTDCHYSLNNPVYVEQAQDDSPEHLEFDPRRLELGEYLLQPLHEFARGQSVQSSLAPELQGTMRSCESCHSLDTTHDWLPYKERHTQVLACETCHIPKMYSNALESLDWTVLTAEGNPRNVCRGIDGDPESLTALVTGFEPAVLPQQGLEGDMRLAPFNLVTTWYWIYDDPPRPVRLTELESAWFEGESYHPEVLALFDENADGTLQKDELIIDTDQKQALIANRLAALGLNDPRITGEVQPYSINHDVAASDWAIRECQECHGDESRLSQPIRLASYTPGGTDAVFVGDTSLIASGAIERDADDTLAYVPQLEEEGIYILGHNAVTWIDRLGGLLFVGVLLGVTAHASVRLVSGYRRPQHKSGTESTYMYSNYERLWHWLQTFTIVALLFTGLIIHKPDTFGVFSFRYVVLVHNILAVILLINAGLALFYHLASGEIRQYLPRPAGFFNQAILQARYYVGGIFRKEPHPFEKRPEQKLNPLQQITYLVILNLLLPLQGITGILMFAVQRSPLLDGWLPYLAPFHTLVAWLFAAFIVLHVYLTTTGPTATTSIKAMMLGWEDIELHPTGEGESA